MAIRIRNTSEFEDFQIFAGGNMAVSASPIYIALAPFPLLLKAIMARVGAAGTTATANVDVRINGTSIFASGAAAIQFASGSATPTYGAMAATNPPVLNKGDQLQIVVTAINTTPAVNLALAISLSRFRGGAKPAAILFDTLGPENE
jgi:hypothetical protein